jgi:2-hydroxychromene-2-carboxylate isomerase
MTLTVVPFYFGLGSRYSYLATTQLERIESSAECRFEWLPIHSGELIRRANRGHSPFEGEPISGQYNWSYRQRDAEAWAKLYQVPYKEPVEFQTDPSDLAKACWAAETSGNLKAMSLRIFQAVFVETRVITRTTLGELASEIGLVGSELIAALDASDTDAKHLAVLDRAIEEGAFGVPSFVVHGQVFWGNDRLALVEHALAHSSPE